MTRATQGARVLEYMKRNRGITQRTALIELGVARLSARILDLKKAGHRISGRMIKVTGAYGDAYVKQYTLEEEAGQHGQPHAEGNDTDEQVS